MKDKDPQIREKDGTVISQTNSNKEEFVKHLEHASKIVRSWPKWKQEILGGTAAV